MDWKLCAEDDLRRYRQMKIGVLNTKDRLRLVSTSLSSRGDVFKRKNGKADSEIINAIVEKERLATNIESAERLLAIIDRGLDSLNEEERRLLEKFYMSAAPSKMRRLSEEFGYEPRTLYRKRDRALAKFTIAMYGLEIS